MNQSPITAETIREFDRLLRRWMSAKAETDRRLREAERWWRLRNTGEEARYYASARGEGHHSASAWLHNVIVNKHADAVEAYPEPHILPREEDDTAQAEALSRILPCLLEQNRFEKTWSDVAWQKLKTGTGVYKVVWDSERLRGLGDIAIERVNLCDLYWEPEVSDIQRSRALFHLEWWTPDAIAERYPALRGLELTSPLQAAEAAGDDRLPLVEVYYKKRTEAGERLHYCRYLGEHILYATENDPDLSTRGLYDHGRYPYVLDPLFPIEDSPCGYGYVDLCRSPQIELDLLKTAFIQNAMVGATPRYFSRGEGVSEEEFLDLTRPIVHVGSAAEDTLRRIEHDALGDTYLALYDRTVKELRETSGNTETGSGNVSAGVTAASAIAALQQASGKSSRDSTASAYRAYGEVIELCIELIRQFYTLPRRFRLGGEGNRFLRFSADGIRPIPQEGEGMGHRLPLFDVKVTARRRNVYTAAATNELTLRLFELGFFDPARRAEATMALDLLDLEGKELLRRRLEEVGT